MSIKLRTVMDALWGSCVGLIEFRALPPPAQKFAALTEKQYFGAFLRVHAEQHCHWGVATRCDDSSGKAENCRHLPALYTDLDFDKIPEAEARQTLVQIPLPPSLVVQSGHGLHGYWFLQEPFDLQIPRECADAHTLLSRLAVYCASDPAVVDVARVLRVPTTFNHKYNPPRLVQVEAFDAARRYDPLEFDGWLPPPTDDTVAKPFKVPAVVEPGNRNNVLFKLGLGAESEGIAPHAIRVVLQSYNGQLAAPLLADEVEQITDSVHRRRNRPTFASSDTAAPAAVAAPAPSTLSATAKVFTRWLYLDDLTPLYVVAAVLVANRAPGDPVWVLLVCAPSTGKTEILSAASRLPWVLPAAKVTEASLLSGTSQRERTSGATGGLLRQVGAFGVLLVKDFTSVLAQNKDARAEAMAALREVYDGSWDWPVGTDGGRVLSWQGKCGLIGGVTPAFDQYGQVTAALGDRFVLLRMPDADVDKFGAAALRHGDDELKMRRELAEALGGLVAHADVRQVNRVLTDAERLRLIKLAAYAARTRTAVMRDGYSHDIAYAPQVEGPGRLVKAFARLLGGLEAIGCDQVTCWLTLRRVALDCAPALRTRFIRDLVARTEATRTAVIASACQTVTKTASRYLEDLSMLGLAVRTKARSVDNSPDLWVASDWLREYEPLFQSETEKYLQIHTTLVRDSVTDVPPGAAESAPVPSGTSRSHFYPSPPAGEAGCAPAETATDGLPGWVTEPAAPDNSDPIGSHEDEAPLQCCLDGGPLWVRCRGCTAVDAAIRDRVHAAAPETVRTPKAFTPPGQKKGGPTPPAQQTGAWGRPY